MIEIRLFPGDLHGHRATAHRGDVEIASISAKVNGSPICMMCRLLQKLGIPDDTELTITRQGKVVFAPTTVGYWALLTTSEGDKSVKLRKYREMPNGVSEQE